MGRWSEEVSGRVCHESPKVKEGEHAVISGEVGRCEGLYGIRV